MTARTSTSPPASTWEAALAGWAMAGHMRTELVEDALKAAWCERVSLTGSVFHSDHGSVYTSKSYASLCEQLGVEDLPQDPRQSQPRYHAGQRRPDADHHRLTSGWKCFIAPNAYEAAVSATLAEAA
jgi:transposase InsO family protein